MNDLRFRLGFLFFVSILVSRGAGTLPSGAAAQESISPCALDFHDAPTAQCTPFTRVNVTVLAAYPSEAFGDDLAPQGLAALDNGSAIVQTERSGLFRLTRQGIETLWPPDPRCKPKSFYFGLAGAFDHRAVLSLGGDRLGLVRGDGSVASRLSSQQRVLGFAQEANSTVWFLMGDRETSVIAYDASSKHQIALAVRGIIQVIGSPDGNVYGASYKGLYVLRARPAARAILVRNWVSAVPGVNLDGSISPIQAVGRDGSLWAATKSQVVHFYPNGKIRFLRLAQPRPMFPLHPIRPLRLSMAPDGSVWISYSMVRIVPDDRVQVMEGLPAPGWGNTLAFAPDSSGWLIVRNSQTQSNLGIVNFVPGSSGNAPTRLPSWAIETPRLTPEPVCPPPTTPPAPAPPSPPRAGRFGFVYAIGSQPIAGR